MINKGIAKKQNCKRVVRTFIIIEFIIYICFLYMDIKNTGLYQLNSAVKFAGILICFFFTWLTGYAQADTDKTDVSFLRGALMFTVISDLMILILDYYIWGVISFIIVQTIYLIRIVRWQNNDRFSLNPVINRILRNLLLAFIVLVTLKISGFMLNTLLVVSSIYFISIFFNVINAVQAGLRHNSLNVKRFALGMFFFLMCDINVGIFNLSSFIILPKSFTGMLHFAAIAMWMFYLPAQVLIVLSGYSTVTNEAHS